MVFSRNQDTTRGSDKVFSCFHSESVRELPVLSESV